MTSYIIIYYDLPFNMFNVYEKKLRLDKILNPNCQFICRQTIALDILRDMRKKEKLKRCFYITCFTQNLWS